MAKQLLKLNVLLMLVLGSIISLNAQLTMPAAYDLSSGDYSYSISLAGVTAGSYPTNWAFHAASAGDPVLTREMDLNYTKAYNLTSGTRITGIGTTGFYFINTAYNATTNPLNLGAAVFAINTTNRNSVKVSWDSKIMAQAPRIYGIRLQYRIGNLGNFQDVTYPNGNPVEVLADQSELSGQKDFVWKLEDIELPREVENQSIVYLRWKYYYKSGAGARPQISLENVKVKSQASNDVAPTKIIVKEVSPAVPSTNFPFDVTIFATDNAGVPKWVSSATTVTLSVVSGDALKLTGPLTATIQPGSYSATFEGLRYSKLEDITLSFSALSSTALKTINFVEGPSALLINNWVGKTHKNFPLPTFTVSAVNDMGNVVTTYTEFDGVISATGPGNITGTLTKTFTNGVATFDGIGFDAPGNYTVSITAPGFLSPITENVLVADEITQTEVIIPDYMKGVGALSSTTPLPDYDKRMPNFSLITLNNLLPNTTYRYYTGGIADLSYDYTPEAGLGGGVCLYYADYDAYIYRSARSLSTADNYSYFTTGPSETSRTMWINVIPTAHAAFNAGENTRWLLAIGSDDGRFIKRFRSDKPSLSCDFGTSGASVTGIYDENSWLEPNTYLAFYDERDSVVTTAVVQSIGVKIQTEGFNPQTPWWFAEFENVNSAWSTYIPNDLAGGIRRIAQYDAKGNLLREWTDGDGVWAGINTALTSGGVDNPVKFETPQLQLLSPVSYEEICNHEIYQVVWNSHGVSTLKIEVSYDAGATFETIATNVPAEKGYFDWDIPRHAYSEKLFLFRITSEEHGYIYDESTNNIIWDNPIQTDVSPSETLCQTESITLSISANGSQLKYQWYKDNKPILGETNSTLDLNKVKYETSGTYHCEVTGNAVCPVLVGTDIEIYVATPTEIAKQPEDQNILQGRVAKFYAEPHIVGQRPNGYIYIQWYKGTTPLVDNDRIAGSRSNLLTINGVTAADEANDYYVVFEGLCPETRVESRRVSLKLVDLMFTQDPAAVIACRGADIEFEALAETSTGETISYQWYKGSKALADDARISGTNGTKLEITNINSSDEGEYRLLATIDNLGIAAWSNPAKLTVDKEPVIVRQPEDNIVVDVANTFTIDFDVESATPLTYQWYKDSVAIPNATDRVYTKDDASASDIGLYHCVATNDCGSTATNQAYVTVILRGITSVTDNLNSSFGLSQISPNPASNIASVAFIAPAGEFVNIKITDALGNEVANAYSGNALGAVENVNVDVSALSSGTYFITLRSAKSISTQRMVVIK